MIIVSVVIAGSLCCLISAILYPSRSPHDVLLGTYLVPR